jgi:hypothetical protein
MIAVGMYFCDILAKFRSKIDIYSINYNVFREFFNGVQVPIKLYTKTFHPWRPDMLKGFETLKFVCWHQNELLKRVSVYDRGVDEII